MKILYKFPSRSRPSKLFACLDNIQRLSTYDNYQIAITADLDDASMMNPEVRDNINSYKNVDLLYGTSLNKVDAINRDMAFYTDWDILINMSDDMQFIQHGFDTKIVDDFKIHGLDTLMHYPDQAAGKALITMAIMGREYFNRDGYAMKDGVLKTFMMDETERIWENGKWVELEKDWQVTRGYIYNPEYKSLFCDNEQHMVAQLRGCYQFKRTRLFNHMHPAWGLAPVDDLMRHTESFYAEDKATFERRKSLNFGI